MVNFRRQLMGLGFIAGSSIAAMSAAHALNGQSNINVDGGPLGQLEMSGGVAGLGYLMSNSETPTAQNHSNGTRVGAVYVQLQKTTGVVQFFVKIGKNNGGGLAIGTGTPSSIGNMDSRSMGPVDTAYITIAPPSYPITFSAGNLGSEIGYESGTIWNDVSAITSVLNDVEIGNQYGVNAQYSKGPVTFLVQFGDIMDTHVFNYLEAYGTYNFDSNNQVTAFYGTNLGRTGPNTHTDGGSGWGSTYLGAGSQNAYFANSTQINVIYNWTHGNLSLSPEAQYVYTKVDHKIGIDKFGSNLGFGLFGDYAFANTPYSLGSWVVWDKSVGSQNTWYVGPNDETVSAAIAPTWQYKYLYARLNGGMVYLLNNKSDGQKYGFGSTGKKRAQFAAVIDTGFVF